MRILSWRLIVALIVGVTLVSLVSSWYEVRTQEDVLRRDQARKAATLGESLAVTAELFLESGDRLALEQMARKFRNRDHLLGIGIYDRNGSSLAVSPNLGSESRDIPQLLAAAKTVTESMRFTRVYIVASPLHGANGTVAGGILMVHDTGYIRTEMLRVWSRAFVRVAIQILVIAAITVLIVRWSLTRPIARMAEWMKALRMGQHTVRPSAGDLEVFLPVAREITPLAESVQRARGEAETEARLRNANESQWTAQRLADQVRNRLDGTSLYVVSNREPYVHSWRDNAITVTVPASGLVTAIEPILCACDGTWVAQGSGDADGDAVDAHDRLKVPPEDPRYTLRRVWLSNDEEAGYYYGFANEGLWPLCHIAHTRPIFRANDWDYYYPTRDWAKGCARKLQPEPGAAGP